MGVLQLRCSAPFGGSGACIPTNNDAVSDGCHGAARTVEFSFSNESVCHTIGGHVLPVGDTFVVGQGVEDDLNAVLLGIKWEFLFVEQLVSRHEVDDPVWWWMGKPGIFGLGLGRQRSTQDISSSILLVASACMSLAASCAHKT